MSNKSQHKPKKRNITEDDWKRMKEDFERNMMSAEEYRDNVIRLIYTDDQQGLKELCKNQSVMSPIMVMKIVKEIKPGNRFNDALYAMAKELMKADPILGIHSRELESKKHLISDPSLSSRQLIAPFVQVEMRPSEYLEKVDLILNTHAMMGLEELVKNNPGNTRSFVIQCLDDLDIDSESKLFMGLSEMAVAYRNCHHSNELVDLIQKKVGPLKLLKDESTGGAFKIFTGTDNLSRLEDEAKQIKKLLVKGKFKQAKNGYQKLIPKMNTLYVNSIPMGGSQYESSLLFYALLLAVDGEYAEAQKVLSTCIEKRYHYGELLLFSTGALAKNKRLIFKTLKKMPENKAESLTFDCFFKEATGFSYGEGHSRTEPNYLFDQFLMASGDRDMDKAFELSDKLIQMYQARANKLISNNFCQILALIFQACYFAMRKNYFEAERRHKLALKDQLKGDQIDREFNNLKRNPEAILTKFFGD